MSKNNQMQISDLLKTFQSQKSKDHLNAKEIDRIFTIRNLSDIEKTKQIQDLCDQAAQLDLDNLVICVNYNICKTINGWLGDCLTQSQQALLILIEIFARSGLKLMNQKIQNSFFQAMYNSGLIEKLKLLIHQKDSLDRKGIQSFPAFSSITTQLLQIYLCFSTRNGIQQDIKVIIQNNLSQNVSALIEMIKKTQIETIIIDKNKVDLEMAFSRGVKYFKAISYISIDSYDVIESQSQLQNLVAPLLHINCPNQLQCPKRISLPDSPFVNEFRISILHAVQHLTQNINAYCSSLNKNHKIVVHIGQFLVNFTKDLNSMLFHDGKFSNSITTPASSSAEECQLSIIFLDNLLQMNTDRIKELSIVPKVFVALLNLVIFNESEQQCAEIVQRAVDIRSKSLSSLYHILTYGNAQIRKHIICDLKYYHTLVGVIGIGGACQEENDIVIHQGIISFYLILQYFRLGDSYNRFPSQLDLVKVVEEQIEQEGADEEIETHIFNLNYCPYYEMTNKFYFKINHKNQYLDWSNYEDIEEDIEDDRDNPP